MSKSKAIQYMYNFHQQNQLSDNQTIKNAHFFNLQLINHVDYNEYTNVYAPILVYKGKQKYSGLNSLSSSTFNDTMSVSEFNSDTVREEIVTKGCVILFGAFQVLDKQARDITPKGFVRKALLALLASSQNGLKSRAYLQSSLWSERSQEQASVSLRNAICILKKELIALGKDIIKTDKSNIYLNKNLISVDADCLVNKEKELNDDTKNLQNYHLLRETFLEGFDIPFSREIEFEEWLREKRSYFQRLGEEYEEYFDKATKSILPRTMVHTPTNEKSSHVIIDNIDINSYAQREKNYGCLALLSPVVLPENKDLTFQANAIMDEIVNYMDAMENVDILDHRMDSLEYKDIGLDNKNNQTNLISDLMFRIKLYHDSHNIKIIIHTFRTDNRKMLWSTSMTIPSGSGYIFKGASVNEFIAQISERILSELFKLKKQSKASISLFETFNLLFKFDHKIVENISNQVEHLIKHGQGRDFEDALAISAYIKTFHVGEYWRKFDKSVIEETEYILSKLIEQNTFNPIHQAIIGHVFGYVLSKHEYSREWFEKALNSSHSLAFVWDHLALHYLYTGDIKNACKASEKAITTGSYSAIRHTFEVTRSMVATFEADYSLAVAYGKKALERYPNFSAALRYTTISAIMSENLELAHWTLGMLRQKDPDFNLETLENQLFVSNKIVNDKDKINQFFKKLKKII